MRCVAAERLISTSPQVALTAPIYFRRDGPQFMLGHRVSAPRDRGHKENGFLQVWREVQEIHDLRDAGSGYVAHRSQLALRAHRPLPNQGIEPNRERHQPRDPGHPTG